MSRSGNVWDNAAMESFFSSLKTERIDRKTYKTRDEAKADVFDYMERFYNPKRRHSTIGVSKPYGIRAQTWIRLSRCHPNRVQAKRYFLTSRCRSHPSKHF
jgi:putative transposase